ncbi:MAG TPA: hypothetical protein PLX66_03380 [Bacilli bacterium]|nr:hypothetical protein [Bacilli bacterium]
MKDSNFEEKFKKAWAKPKSKAAIKLGFYLLGMIIICIIASVGSRMSSTEEENKEEEITYTYADKLVNIGKKNFSYVYEVTINEEKTIFTGEKLANKELGYKESSEKTLKYYIDDDTYEIVFGEKKAITDLYEGINKDFLDIDYLLAKIDSLKGEYQNEGNETYYTYSDILNNLNVNVYFNDEVITKISISNLTDNYILEFSKIGEITEKDLTL